MRSIDGDALKLAFIALAATALAACSDEPTAPAARPRALASVAADGDSVLAVTAARDTIHVRRGGRDSVELRIARPAGLADSVRLAVDSLPAGLTATLSQAATTDSGVTLVVEASDSAAVGAARLVVRASAGAREARPLELTVAVRTTAFPDGPADAAWTFCDSSAAPVWFAHQEGDGPWTRVPRTGTPDSAVFAFSAKGRGAIAYVTRERDGADEGYELSVFYGTPAELAAFAGAQCIPADSAPPSPRQLRGSVAGADMTSMVTVSMGGATASVMAMQPAFTLRNVAPGPQDLVAALAGFSFDGEMPSLSLSKLIIRRKLDLADGATIPTLDFASDEAFAPASPKLTVEGAGAAQVTTSVSYQTAGGATAMLFAGPAGERYFGVPVAKQAKGDLHVLSVMAMPPGAGDDDELPPGMGGAPAADADGMRGIVTHFREAKDRTIILGPELAEPAVTQLPGGEGKHLRWRAKAARQAEYAAGFTLRLDQEDARRAVSLTVTEAYVGDAAAWEPAMPDLSGVEGFDPKWAPREGARVAWSASAYGGDFFDARGQYAREGASYRFASRTGTAVTPARR